MPHRTGVFPFEPGDDDMADFMENIWRPFATDAKASGGLAWIEQAPARGTHPDFDFIFSRGTVGTEAPPFAMFHTSAKSLWIFTGDGVNTAQEVYDQPGNPMNHPESASYGDPTGTFKDLAHQFINTAVGPYSAYWLFGGPTGEYLHCVLKVGTREYRHFHVGMLSGLHSDLDADSFYITGHCIEHLSPDNLTGDDGVRTAGRDNHQPYNRGHRLPFQAMDNQNISFVGGGQNFRNRGLNLYMPNLGTNVHDWYHNLSDEGRADNGSRDPTTNGNFSDITTTEKSVGDVNNGSDAVLFGVAQCNGYDQGLGAILHAAEPTFTSDGIELIPIIVSAYRDFESDNRWAPVAQVPDVFRVNMKGLQPEQVISESGEDYIVFPIINDDSNNTLTNEGYSGYEGLAYRRITANAT